jgi:large subunit ribosomal protein L10
MRKDDKPKIVHELSHLIDSYSVIGVLNMRKMPARALGQMKESMRGQAVIRMSRKTLIKKALHASKKENVKLIEGKLTEVPALLMTNENPFRLFKLLKDNRTPAAAKPGDIALSDITIQKGSTNLPPGPSISVLQKVGLKTSVQAGKIAVMADKVVCKAGEKVSQELADVLSLLKIEPMEIGLDLAFVWENGTIYGREVLDVSAEDYIAELMQCAAHGVNLSVNTGYVTKTTAPIMIQKAFSEARSLCIEANALEAEFIDEVLRKASREAKLLKELMI